MLKQRRTSQAVTYISIPMNHQNVITIGSIIKGANQRERKKENGDIIYKDYSFSSSTNNTINPLSSIFKLGKSKIMQMSTKE